MRIAIYGAGAIGGLLGAKLARTSAQVSLLARGAHLEAIRNRGLCLVEAGESAVVRVRATDDPAELGPQDYVIVAVKAQAVAGIARTMQPLLGPDTAVVMAVNGLPWWYFHGLDGPLAGHRLASVDPDGVIWDTLGPERAIGCVVYPAVEVTEPGVVTHISGDRFTLGEPSGERTARVEKLAALLISAGFKAPVRPNIRDEIWVKLWGNLSFNPISALTCATLDMIGGDAGTRAIARAMMLEAQAIGARLGVRFAVDVDKRIDGAAAIAGHRTSMLQDLERGRPMEIDALVAVVQELGRLLAVPTPTIDTVLALVRLRARVAGCYG